MPICAKGLEVRGNEAEHALHAVERRRSLRQERAGRHAIGGVELGEQPRLGGRVIQAMAVAAVEDEIAAEVRIAREDLVAAFARHHDLDAGIADGAAQKVLGDRVRVHERPLGVVDRVAEVIGHVFGADVDAAELGAGALRLIAGEVALVVVRVIERERVGAERPRRVARREAEHGARIDAAAQIAGDRHVRAQPQPDRLVERVLEPLDPLAPVAVRVRRVGGRVVPVPVRHDADLLAVGQQIARRRELIDALEERAIGRVRDEVDVVQVS